MKRRKRKEQPIKFTLRFYPGQDDDLIDWLEKLEGDVMGAKTQRVKDALRSSVDGQPAPGEVPVSPASPGVDLAEMRQVVEAAVVSAIARCGGLAAGGVSPAPAEQDEEADRLLAALDASLMLGDE